MSAGPCCVNVYDQKAGTQYCGKSPTMFINHSTGGGPICKEHREEFGWTLRRCVCGADNTTENEFCPCGRRYRLYRGGDAR